MKLHTGLGRIEPVCSAENSSPHGKNFSAPQTGPKTAPLENTQTAFRPQIANRYPLTHGQHGTSRTRVKLKGFQGLFGGARRNRTDDLFHAMEALSQLSYGPTRHRGKLIPMERVFWKTSVLPLECTRMQRMPSTHLSGLCQAPCSCFLSECPGSPAHPLSQTIYHLSTSPLPAFRQTPSLSSGLQSLSTSQLRTIVRLPGRATGSFPCAFIRIHSV